MTIVIRTEDDRRWAADRDAMRWTLPLAAPRGKRLPIIRKFRAFAAAWRAEQHYAFYDSIGALRSGYDDWVDYAIERGWV